jgi:hypothetical protein
MSTRRTPNSAKVKIDTGFESSDAPGDIAIPPCTIEDLDRSVFSLFDTQLPLQVKQKGKGTKKVPVIFATGERFAILRRKIPLGDRGPSHSALILPLVSIQRTGISQDPDNGTGPGQTLPIVIKRRLSEDNPIYKRLVNEMGLRNADDAATDGNNLVGGGAAPGSLGTRRDNRVSPDADSGRLLRPQLSNNIYETLTIPPTKYYTATYEVSIWAQYTQEMNEMLMTIMSLYQNNHRRTFRLETPKGYWFVGYVSSDLSADNNIDEFTDQERIIRYSFSIKANGYIIAPQYPGSPAYVRRYISAPKVEFDVSGINSTVVIGSPSPQAWDPNGFILEDLYSETNDLVDSAVARPGGQEIIDSLDMHTDTGPGVQSTRSSTRVVSTRRDIFTGTERRGLLFIKPSGGRGGEAVYKEQIVKKLDDI